MSSIPIPASLLVWTCLANLACSGGKGLESKSGVATNEDFGPLLERAVTEVIVPTYATLYDRALALSACAETLAQDLTDEQLAQCQEAWIAARVPWERSEGFLFGPVADRGIDPAVDSWPVDYNQLNALMASDTTLNVDTLTQNLGGGLKGFHTIEFLLWGNDHQRTATDLLAAPRELEYLVAVTGALVSDTQALWMAWAGSGSEMSYGEQFSRAGKRGGLYPHQLDALHELIGGMIAICDEVAYGKLAEPHHTRDPNLIESQFSRNSLRDFADNIRSVQNIYFGALDGAASGDSLSAVVEDYAPELDDKLRMQLARSIGAIEAIGKGGLTFRDVVLDSAHDAAIEKAERSIGELMETLNDEMLPMFAH